MARQLRKDMSPAERRLWRVLREHPGGFKFRKQCPQGAYSLDFACLASRLAIEVDGDAHDFGDRPRRDERRDDRLKELGFKTMRIPAGEVFRNLEGVVLGIVEACRIHAPPRNGEGDHGAKRHGGGVGAQDSRSVRPHHPSPAASGPPPRSGEELQ
jgi:very-short-patch-repair endonuclease